MFLGGFDGIVTSTVAPIATGWSDPLAGREFHPLKNHTLPRRTIGFVCHFSMLCAVSLLVLFVRRHIPEDHADNPIFTSIQYLRSLRYLLFNPDLLREQEQPGSPESPSWLHGFLILICSYHRYHLYHSRSHFR